MDKISNIIVTKIDEVLTVSSPKGRYVEMKDRWCYGLSFCSSGKITYTHNGVNYVSDKSCAVILPKGQSYTLYGNESGFFPVINFECENFLEKDFRIIPLRKNDSYLKDFERMKNLSLFENSQAKIMSIFYDILSRLDSEHLKENNILKIAADCIEASYTDPSLNNTMLAQKMHISEVYFRRIFKESFGISPKQYILDIRIRKAKQLLYSGNISVTKVSEQCGFSSVYHFCRIFKEKTGLTPTEYIKNAGKYGL